MVLIAGGNPFGATNTAEIYNPTGQTFTSTSGAMGTARALQTATMLSNGKVLVTGGVTTGLFGTQTAELYDPVAGTFSATGSLLVGARYEHAATMLLDGTVLVTGGYNGQFNGACGVGCMSYSDGQVYNPALGTFTAVGNSMSTTLHYAHTSTLLDNGLVLITGGGAATGGITSTDIF